MNIQALYLTVNLIVSLALLLLILQVTYKPAKNETPSTRKARIAKIGVYICVVLGAIASIISSLAFSSNQDLGRNIIFFVLLGLDLIVFIISVVFMFKKPASDPTTNKKSMEMVDIETKAANAPTQENNQTKTADQKSETKPEDVKKNN